MLPNRALYRGPIAPTGESQCFRNIVMSTSMFCQFRIGIFLSLLMKWRQWNQWSLCTILNASKEEWSVSDRSVDHSNASLVISISLSHNIVSRVLNFHCWTLDMVISVYGPGCNMVFSSCQIQYQYWKLKGYSNISKSLCSGEFGFDSLDLDDSLSHTFYCTFQVFMNFISLAVIYANV
jgi:hypothetical protein